MEPKNSWTCLQELLIFFISRIKCADELAQSHVIYLECFLVLSTFQNVGVKNNPISSFTSKTFRRCLYVSCVLYFHPITTSSLWSSWWYLLKLINYIFSHCAVLSFPPVPLPIGINTLFYHHVTINLSSATINMYIIRLNPSKLCVFLIECILDPFVEHDSKSKYWLFQYDINWWALEWRLTYSIITPTTAHI